MGKHAGGTLVGRALVGVAALAVLLAPSVAAAQQVPPDGDGAAGVTADDVGESLPGDGAAHDHPEDQGSGHLPGSSHNVELVGQADIAGGGSDRVADVSAFGDYAYLTVRDPVNCVGPEAAGVAVFDISDPTRPHQVGFIPSTPGSQPGEGSQVIHLETAHFSGELLVFNNEIAALTNPRCELLEGQPSGGASLWDVTDPLAPVLLTAHAGDPTGPVDLPGVLNDIHSAFAWQAGDRAFVVLVDNWERLDVDILEITDPRNPVLLSETDLNQLGVAQEELLTHGTFPSSRLHDMVVRQVDGVWTLLASYWDGGWVLLDVDDPAQPRLIGDFDYPFPDTLLPSVEVPEGNAHQAEFTRDNRFIIGTDEDFTPFRVVGNALTVTSGPHAGDHPAGLFRWTRPLHHYPDGEVNGPTVYGGLGCPSNEQYGEQPPLPDPATLTPAPGEERIVVLLRGLCLFSQKVEQAQLAGYDAVIIANHHAGAGGGEAPEQPLCGAQGHEFEPTIAALCLGHRGFHLLFDDEPEYEPVEAGRAGDEPPLGAVGASVRAASQFDGWGYVRMLDAETLEEIDAYAIDEALDPAFAEGFGTLSVHEVATDPDQDLAYFSYYAGGFRVAEYDETGLREVGHFIAEEGNDFWGVEVHKIDGETFVLASDRDSGLWIFQYAPCTVTGTDGNDLLTGTDGDDVICGAGGDDVLMGLAGHDVLRGGDGDDVLVGDGGDDRLVGQAGHDVALAGPGDDQAWGHAGDDTLAGSSGHDGLWGGPGADTLFGEDDDDALDGGPDADRCQGGPGEDALTDCEEQVLTAALTGEAETAGGDPEGSGTATVVVTGSQVCATLAVSGVQLPATGAHIHEAPAGQDGPVVVALAAPDATGGATGCTDVDPALGARIAAEPHQFYVNVHTEELPAGAVRGQLE